MKQQRNFSFIKSLFYEQRLKLICVLACVVVFCTVSALVIPAIAQEGDVHCGLKEHSHSDECYEKKLVCGQDEGSGHVHDDKCYDSVLLCEKKEHTHELSCYSDSDADIETAENWESTFSKVKLSGDYRNDVLAIAKSQLGYRESEKNYKVDENGDAKGYTRYGAWYGDEYGDWSCMFVSFCLDYANVELTDGGKSCTKWIETLNAKECNRYHDAVGYSPKQGDLIFVDSDEDGQADRMGFVAEVNEETQEKDACIKTIEGDSDNSVQYVEYEQTDKRIIGYGQLPEHTNKTVLTYEGKDYTVNVSYEKAAKLPEDTELSVKEITGDEYDKSIEKAKKALKTDELGFARFFDISFVKDGKELEPEASVDVSITYQDEVKIAAGESASAVHFAESGVEVLEAEVDDSKAGGDKSEEETTKVDTFNFTQDSFSVTGTVVAVNDLAADKSYMIITRSKTSVINEYNRTEIVYGPYYALAGDGTGVMIKSYDPDTGVAVLFKGTDDEVLKWKYDKTKKTMPLRNENTGKYLNLTAEGMGEGKVVSDSVTSENDLEVQKTGDYTAKIRRFHEQRRVGGMFIPRYEDYYFYLRLDAKTGNFTSKSESGEESASGDNVYFVSDIIDEGDSSGSAVVHNYDFPNKKRIDYLGDGNADKDKNPDTDVKGEDMYRLYLDISGNTEPMDLLIVVDRSGSMQEDMAGKTKGTDADFNENDVRSENVTKLLNGQKDSVTDAGFISRFLSLNSKNKIAVTTFEGMVLTNGDTGDDVPDLYSKNYRYDKYDCATLLKWTSAEDYSKKKELVDCKGKVWNGTNYMAGLALADTMFSEVKGDGNKKMMIFISDGVPTYYLIDTGNKQYDRGGNRGVAYPTPLKESREATMTYFKDYFIKNNPEVLVHTVGISAGINGATADTNPEVLKYMADLGGGNFVAAADAVSMNEISKLVFPKGTIITDKLSSYVQYYETDPDIKVTRTSADGQTTQTLYENRNITGYGENILDPKNPVTYTPSADTDSTGTVTAKFKEDFVMEHSWTYTLSFNVKATDKAYEEYAKDNVTSDGEVDTDYVNNKTSSGKKGLYSNKEATVKYTINDIEYTEDYPKPVIQVDRCCLTLTKKDEEGNPLSGVVFALKRGSDTVGTYKTDENGKVEIPSGTLLKGDYTLEETSTPDGYIQTKEAVSFKVENGMITGTQTYNDWSWDLVATKNANKADNEYPKDNTYKYALSLINRSKPQQVILRKTDEEGAPLNGATFSLYRDCASTADGAQLFRITVGDKEKTVWGIPVDGKQDMASEDENVNGMSLGGVICNEKLNGGKYYLLENKAPDGYHRLEEPVVITVGKSGVNASYCGQWVSVTDDGKNPITYTVKILNTRGYILPNTGGSGTGWYMLGGMLIMTTALLCYINKRRRKEANRL